MRASTAGLPGRVAVGVPKLLDDRVPDDSVLVIAGLQLERLSGLPAMVHACRVDPRAERISMLHRGGHPGAAPQGNRKSMALVLAIEEYEW